jgi:nucleoside-diphosphate-sugar epimerase
MGGGAIAVTVLVTGGGGFLGRSIIRALRDRGEQVRSFARGDYPQLHEWGVEQFRGDIGDAETVARAVAGCTAVFHTAARVEMWGPYQEFVRVNAFGTLNVIHACMAHGVPKLIYTSTPSVVHGGDSVAGVDESAPYPTHFEADYPKTKAMAERAVLEFNCEALATVAIRPHLVWGPGDTSMMPRVIAKARAGKVRLIGPPQPVDTLYIDNAVDAHLAAHDRLKFGAPPAGRAYFVTQGQPVSNQQFLNDLLVANGLPPVEKRISVGVARRAAAFIEELWKLFEIRSEPPITRFVVSQLSTAHWYDISAARRELGYTPRVSYEEGMQRLRASITTHELPVDSSQQTRPRS